MSANYLLAAAVAAASVISAPAAKAQGSNMIVKAAIDTQCELHVWPAERFAATTTGLLSGFGIVGAVVDASGHANTNSNNRTQIASALDSAGQISVLQSMNPVELLGMDSANVIYHSQALDPKAVGKVKTRQSESRSNCYAELIVGAMSYYKAAMYGRAFHTSFIFREFGSSNDNPIEYRGVGSSGLRKFPPKEGEDVQAANDELLAAFRQNFTFYTDKARKALRSKRAKANKG